MSPAGSLSTRFVVGAVLILVALTTVWAGGLAFAALVTAAVLLMSAEWSVMHGVPRGFRLASLVALAFVGGVEFYVGASDALIVLAASAGLVGMFMRGFDGSRAFWVAAGLLYCGLPMIALLWIRSMPLVGLGMTIGVFVIVWTTDTAAFFVGRAVGGAKFAPKISPNKTWAGVAGGTVAAATVAAILQISVFHRPFPSMEINSRTLLSVAVLGAFFGSVAVGGDLFESWLKRRAGVKDSGNVLPGHGGVMDRIDGLVPVAVCAALLAYASGIGR